MSSDEDEETEIVDSDDIEPEPATSSTREEQAETRSIEARRQLRGQLESEIEAFLRSGGRIEQVAANVSAQDNPKVVAESA